MLYVILYDISTSQPTMSELVSIYELLVVRLILALLLECSLPSRY
jgi:hypothetical protein